MKKALKIISTASIVLFGILLISSKFDILSEFNSADLRNVFVVIYLLTSVKHFHLEVEDRKAEIKGLKRQLEKVK